jgi:choice-of-anchor B domain-containing protein
MESRHHVSGGRWCAVVVLLLSVFLPHRSQAQTAQLDTLRHLNLRPGGGYSAIWGYTAPNGREYAILGCNGSGGRQAGTSFVDVTDNSNIREVAFIPGPASSWREMKTYRQYAYVVTEGGGGTQIIDISFLPDSARLVRSFIYTSGSKNTASSHTITITDGFMYLNGCANWGTQNQRGIIIFDLRSDPTNPQFLGEYSPAYIHDSYVLRDTIYGSAIYSGGGVFIADARNKSNVQTIGHISYAGSGTHNSWVTKDRRYLITTDEIGTITPKQLQVWDISNLPTIPTVRTSAFTINPGVVVHNVTVRGDYAYSVWYSGQGIQIVNMSNPLSPTLAAGYAIPGSTDLDWGIYPYFPSGKIVIGDDTNGLWVFRFSALASRVPVNLLAPANGAHVNSSAPITFRWTKTADISKDPHYYEVRITGPGIDTTWNASDSITTFSAFSRLQTAQTYSWRVTVRDEWNTTPSVQTNQFVYDGPNDVEEQSDVPRAFALDQNYPNPFNPVTNIQFSIANSQLTIVKVYDVLGREVATLVNEPREPGNYQVQFDASRLGSGVYFYTLKAGGFATTRKMLIMK